MVNEAIVGKILLELGSKIAKETAKQQENCIEKVIEKFLEVSGGLADKGVIDKKELLKVWKGLEVNKDLTKFGGKKKGIRIKFGS
jgi:hypothetical protein